jgi:hypothetical protein
MENVRSTAGIGLPDVRDLRASVAGEIVVAGDERWDEARAAWNLAVDQQPVAVAIPENARDVVEILAYARDCGLQVAPQGTGHSAAPLGALRHTILLKTHRMRGVEIDPETRTARVEAGVLWIEVVEAAAEHGLAALAGSSPDVGVVGYTLGGGLSWLARKHGIGANHVTAVELVTADGTLRRVDPDNDPDLFWAVRGGGGAFGVVTALEFNLFPISQVYAGILWFPVERAAEILGAWRRWTETVPDEMTSVGRILQFPPIDEIPAPVRGKAFAIVEAIYCGSTVDGGTYVEPLRALGPVMDTVGTIPVQELSHLHMDPDEPVAAFRDGSALDDVDDELIELFIEGVVGKPIVSAEIRHLGGAVGRAKAEHGAVAGFESPYVMSAVGLTPTADATEAVEGAVRGVRASLESWQSPNTYLNFAESRRSARSLFSEATYHRLRRVKAAYDPENVIRSNHPID